MKCAGADDKTHVGSVVVPAGNNGVSRRKAEILQCRIRVAVGVGSGGRCGRDGTEQGDGGNDGGGELHVDGVDCEMEGESGVEELVTGQERQEWSG